ncbi:transporter substrate-binding domain-containing protein [uncultured Microbulbifer sp.]|uniref:transporter substrate-binding domain-containing protein n=1 Tax=uncultured Microbulbifer sp. TaxID=348147 RepID=UPI0025D48D88|nr:transporter substrate-binding domain-containing protein [uncultured Microbulbifer sp.]
MTFRLGNRGLFQLFGAVTLLLFVLGCEQQISQNSSSDKSRYDVDRTDINDSLDFMNYREVGDLESLKRRGFIRFATYTYSLDDQLPRASVVSQRHRDLARQFAKRLGLHPVWIQANSPAHGIELLRSGLADVIADNFTDTPQRHHLIGTTQAIFQAYQVLITSADGPEIQNPEDLKKATILAISGTVFSDTAKKLTQMYPNSGLTIKEIEIRDNPDELMDSLNRHPGSITILDSNTVQGILEYRNDFKMGARVSEKEGIVWAVRKDALRLRTRLNNYLTRRLVSEHEVRTSDWNDIKDSGVIRLLTHNTATSYYLWKGVLMGFDYDLAKAFADHHNLELQVVVVPYGEDLVEWLKQGRGDIAGSSTTITQARKQQGATFSIPYLRISGQVLSNRNQRPIETLQDLDGRTLTVRYSSSFSDVIRNLRRNGIDVKQEIAPVSFAQLVNMLAEGDLDAIAGDSHAVEIEASLRPELQAGVMLTAPRSQAWMVLPKNTVLLKNVNVFLNDYKTTSAYRQKVDAYFKPSGRYGKRAKARIDPDSDLSPFDTLVQSSSQVYDFDWKLIVAQMWQESSFNPSAVSPVGAQGLLQVMPGTAEDMGFTPPLFDPDRGIQAGVKYLSWVRDRFDTTMPVDERLWFSLAAYNAGYAHVLDAKRLCEKLGLDANIWFNNVEVAMLKLSEPRYYNTARYGFVRGAEPVRYVRNIRELYRAYTSLSEGRVIQE